MTIIAKIINKIIFSPFYLEPPPEPPPNEPNPPEELEKPPVPPDDLSTLLSYAFIKFDENTYEYIIAVCNEFTSIS